MSEAVKTGIARRPLLVSIATVLGLGAAGAFVYEVPRLFGRRYPRTKFDDLLDQIPDRESAARLGHASFDQVARRPGTIDGFQFDAKAAANELRSGPSRGSLQHAAEADIAGGRLVELQGWVLPWSIVLVSMIAAKVQPASDAA